MATAARLARSSVVAAATATAAVLLSYLWLGVRAVQLPEPAWMVPLTIASEIGAVVLGVTAIGLGVSARRRPDAPSHVRRRARRGILAGIGIIMLVVLGNVTAVLLAG